MDVEELIEALKIIMIEKDYGVVIENEELGAKVSAPLTTGASSANSAPLRQWRLSWRFRWLARAWFPPISRAEGIYPLKGEGMLVLGLGAYLSAVRIAPQ